LRQNIQDSLIVTGDTREANVATMTVCSTTDRGEDLQLTCVLKQYPTLWSWLAQRGSIVPAVAKMIREREKQ
jgi:hypothetical protein